jgi:hypothetical protein
MRKGMSHQDHWISAKLSGPDFLKYHPRWTASSGTAGEARHGLRFRKKG